MYCLCTQGWLMTGLVYVLFMYIGLVDDRFGLCNVYVHRVG